VDAFEALWFALKQVSRASSGFYERPRPNMHAAGTFSVKCHMSRLAAERDGRMIDFEVSTWG
jgi:hypothetical protein